MKGYFKLPNLLFDLELTPAECLIYTYFLSIHGQKEEFYCKQNRIATKLHYSKKTITTGINGLVAKGLLKKRANFRYGRRVTNSYAVNLSPLSKKGFFFVPRTLFLHESLKKTSLLIYLYLRKSMNQKQVGFPSLSQISHHCNLSRSTVVTGIKELNSLGFLHKVKQKKKDTSFGHNMYVIVQLKLQIRRIKTRTKSKKKTTNLCRPVVFFKKICTTFSSLWRGG